MAQSLEMVRGSTFTLESDRRDPRCTVECL